MKTSAASADGSGKSSRKRVSSLSKAKHATRILSTIDQLRDRKARPDIDRICHMVRRQHGLSSEQTRSELDMLVAENLVVKVDYKGNTSYRNAAKFRRKRLADASAASGTTAAGGSSSSEESTKRSKTGRRIVKAVKNLTKRCKAAASAGKDVGGSSDAGSPSDAAGKEKGVSLEQIEKWIRDKWGDEKAEPTEIIKAAIDVEVEKGNLTELPNGKYALPTETSLPGDQLPKRGPGRPKGDEKGRVSVGKIQPLAIVTATDEIVPGSSSTTPDANVAVVASATKTVSPKKLGGRRKKVRKSLEPESDASLKKSRMEADVSDGKEMRADASTAADADGDTNKCTYCQSVPNRAGATEELLICKDCQAKIHPSCMDLTEELARRAARSPWQCIDCKTCNVCDDSGDAEEMLFCDACDKGYHMNCHKPPVLEKPTGKWVCCRCVSELELELDADTAAVPEETKVTEVGASVDSQTGECGGTSCLPTPSDSPVHFQTETVAKEVPEPVNCDTAVTLPKLSATMSGDPPDASSWSVAEVAKFFADVGFTEQAETFRAEEIDGKALLLMTRNDVLTGMSFKLGPALKIYAHVQRLQTYDANFMH